MSSTLKNCAWGGFLLIELSDVLWFVQLELQLFWNTCQGNTHCFDKGYDTVTLCREFFNAIAEFVDNFGGVLDFLADDFVMSHGIRR